MKNKGRWARREKRMLWWSSGVCILALGLGGLYEWNNRVPDLQIPQAALPADNAYDRYARAIKLYPVPNAFTPVAAKGTAVDGQLDNFGDQPPLYSAAYRARYPVARQRAYLRANGAALGEVRAGLALPYLQPPERDGASTNGAQHRGLARLLLVEAHARGGAGDWDGAADSLLAVRQLGVQTGRGGAWRAFLSSQQIMGMAHDELWLVLPHLSATRARAAARQIEGSQPIQATQALEEEKRAMQSGIIDLIRKRDWRPLYVSYGCIGGCTISDEEKERALNGLPATLKMRLAWINKTAVLEEYTRCMDWQIAQARQPYSARETAWPFPDSKDAVEQMMYPQFRIGARFTPRMRGCQDRLLTVALALHAYREENGAYPQTLSQLVPRYLARVPLDPFSDGGPLLYAPVAKRYVREFVHEPAFPYNPAIGGPPAQTLPAPPVMLPVGPPEGPPEGPQVNITPRIHAYQPYKLWSRGPNARDDGGVSCIVPDKTDARHRYKVTYDMKDAACDIVAGINH